ncbi:MAG: hypothetical protein ACI857_001931 [Arenicella sp.]|jgi:hypothetical protein
MKAIPLILSVFITVAASAQTKLIAFKSHSGSMHNFENALSNPKMDLMNHNLGGPPNNNLIGPQILMPTVSEIDSLIFISETEVVIITSNYCSNPEFLFDTTEVGLALPWSGGKDTVINHPLFSRQHSLDSIKAILKRDYNFRNDIEKTVFIGYDNENDENSSPVIVTPSSPSGGIGIILSSLLLASLLIGLMSWIMSRLPKAIEIRSVQAKKTNNHLA